MSTHDGRSIATSMSIDNNVPAESTKPFLRGDA